MNYPHLVEQKNCYWIAEEKGYFSGIVSKSCDLADASWLQKSWQHELNWEGEVGQIKRLAYEKRVSFLLAYDKVIPAENRNIH